MEVASARAPGAHDAPASFADAEDARRVGDVSDATDPMASFSQEVLEEAGSDYEPAYEEIVEYARWLGVKQHETREFLWIAKEGLGASLPENWKPCRTGDGQVYYFNFATGESDWDHPCDAVFRAKVIEEREKREGSSKGPSDGGPAADTSAESGDGSGSSFHSAAGGNTKHSAMFLDDLASDVSGDASKTFDRSFASPRPPAGKGTPSPRPVGPVARGLTRTPLGRVDGNVARDGTRATKRAGARTPAGAHESSSRKRTPATNGANDENVLDLSALSQRSNVSNVSNVSRGSRGRLASLPSLGKDPLAKKPALGDVLRKKPLGAAVAEAPRPSEPKKQTSFPAAADAEDVSDVSSKSFPSLVLDDDLDLEDLGDVASRAPPEAVEAEGLGSRARTDAASPPRSRCPTRTATKTELVDASTIPDASASASESAASLRAALERALGEKQDAVRARERAETALAEAETALAKREDAEKTRDAVSAAAFEAERKTLAANAVSAETRAREAEDRCEALRRHASAMEARAAAAAAVDEATEAMASIISEKFAEQRDAWSAERSALETTTRECVSRFEKAADAAALSAARIAERTFSSKRGRSLNPNPAEVRGPTSPRPPRSPNSTRRFDDSMESLTDISASSAETRRRSPGRPASPRSFGDADAGRVRIRGRNLRPQPPSAGSSPATSPRSVSPRRRERGCLPSRSPSVFVEKASTTRSRSARTSPSPAAAAAAAAAETCARLVDRLERLRAADAAARRRGWPSGDDARARETEAWLQRERASLGSFRRVAALSASS